MNIDTKIRRMIEEGVQAQLATYFEPDDLQNRIEDMAQAMLQKKLERAVKKYSGQAERIVERAVEKIGQDAARTIEKNASVTLIPEAQKVLRNNAQRAVEQVREQLEEMKKEALEKADIQITVGMKSDADA